MGDETGTGDTDDEIGRDYSPEHVAELKDAIWSLLLSKQGDLKDE